MNRILYYCIVLELAVIVLAMPRLAIEWAIENRLLIPKTVAVERAYWDEVYTMIAVGGNEE